MLGRLLTLTQRLILTLLTQERDADSDALVDAVDWEALVDAWLRG